MKSESKNFWDWVSAIPIGAPKEPKGTARRTLEAAQKHLHRESAVLDFGCGNGDLSLAIAPKVKVVHAIDTSRGMIEVAEARASQAGVENVNFAKLGLREVGHLSGTLDLVAAFNVLHYVDDPGEIFGNIHELLSPGGLFISSTACLGERRTILGTLAQALTKLGVMPPMRVFKEAELTALVVGAGFGIVATEELSKLPDYFIVAEKR